MSEADERDGETRKVYKDHNPHVLWGVTLVAVLGVSSVTPAFPRIVQDLGVSGGQVGRLITVFTLPRIVLTPVLGVLSDRHGRKKILVLALLLFGVAQGMNLPDVLSLLNSQAPNENRGAFMAPNGMALRTGQTVVPLLMASLAGTLGATGAFRATAVIALLAFLLALAAVR